MLADTRLLCVCLCIFADGVSGASARFGRQYALARHNVHMCTLLALEALKPPWLLVCKHSESFCAGICQRMMYEAVVPRRLHA
jgi:hypothetical protein